MRDPWEDVDDRGCIVTGAARARVPLAYEPVLEAALIGVADAAPDAELHLYGSVATGRAVIGRSDVDLLAIGLPADTADALERDLSARFAGLCRSVDVGAVRWDEYDGDGDIPYGNRVFRRHYCVPLTRTDREVEPPYPADRRAARAFNGDLGRHAAGWRNDPMADPAALARRVGRKTLLAVAGLVSIHDRTWTTDREAAAHRWAELEPGWAGPLRTLFAWGESTVVPDPAGLRDALAPDGVVAAVETVFADRIGFWADDLGSS
ncbi:nucleotidyltransferase domain-containing protein [Microlunatus parietis]|uniref:Polymerase nucleotidyl transferase domain-containing protein n=1 Tax=Microlunatus parietis TaxID=682979 RepID=A0A7Y9I2Q8_9ACTN|nr:nucleotidyltransferase domain-containing protein [Microlunatus parietis]NYE69153.1 hypothetical protein [Microlunatus parietis]